MFLGIDFGTSNSSAALMIGDRPRLVKEPVKQGYSFPSSIYLTEEGEILVGQIAENRKFLDLTRYRREFKKDLLQNTPYFLGSQGEYEFSPQESIAEVIKTLKKEADKITTSLGIDNVTNAVITIPASYKKNKKDLMKEAAKKAGLTSAELLEEPVAAAIYYNYQNPATFQEGDIILIYDLGGGTFDATLIEKIGNSFQILGQPVGIENCGGINFDRAIFENLKNFCNTDRDGLNLIDKNQKNLLLDFCRDIKHQFSSYTNAAGQIPISGQTYQLAASDFNRAIASYVEQTLNICENLIKSVGLETRDISQVLMVGGSCRIPYIQESIKIRLKTSVLLVDEPELAVCQGAAIKTLGHTEWWEQYEIHNEDLKRSSKDNQNLQSAQPQWWEQYEIPDEDLKRSRQENQSSQQQWWEQYEIHNEDLKRSSVENSQSQWWEQYEIPDEATNRLQQENQSSQQQWWEQYEIHNEDLKRSR